MKTQRSKLGFFSSSKLVAAVIILFGLFAVFTAKAAEIGAVPRIPDFLPPSAFENTRVQQVNEKRKDIYLPSDALDTPNVQKINIIFVGRFVGGQYMSPQASKIGEGAKKYDDPPSIVMEIIHPITASKKLLKGMVIALPDNRKDFSVPKGDYLVLAMPLLDTNMPYINFVKVDNPEQQIIPLTDLTKITHGSRKKF